MRFIHRLAAPYVLALTFVLALLLSLYSIAVALGSEASTRLVEGIRIVDSNRDTADEFLTHVAH
jgi:ABC-type transporter Mla maintaining outer membrane lipid asymmetry permease subunit MlaE